jgi:hypothetical protein
MRYLACAVALISAFAGRADAAVCSTVTLGTSALSLTGAVAGTAGGVYIVVKSNSWYGTFGGTYLALGSIFVGGVDPDPATFYDGQFTFHYDAKLMRLRESGWLGDWGINASLPPPPANRDDWYPGLTFALQDPAAGLSVVSSVDPINGLQSVSFDWGPGGHTVPGTEPFNFFASAFEAKVDLVVTYMGTAATPPAGANFFVSSAGIRGTCPGEDTVKLQGHSETQYFKVSPVPEPSMMVIGTLFGLGGLIAKRRMKK